MNTTTDSDPTLELNFRQLVTLKQIWRQQQNHARTDSQCWRYCQTKINEIDDLIETTKSNRK